MRLRCSYLAEKYGCDTGEDNRVWTLHGEERGTSAGPREVYKAKPHRPPSRLTGYHQMTNAVVNVPKSSDPPAA